MLQIGRGRFEGWYFKHRIGGRVFAAIPGIAADARGKRAAFIQTIDHGGSRFFAFPSSQYRARRAPLEISVGDNRFSARGIRLSLPGIRAQLAYGALTPLDGDIMGPFARVPFMECYHGVDSLLHRVDGYVETDGARQDFGGGSGYIERDWGRSFPRSWVWMECHSFAGQPGDSVMLAVAEIPLLGLRFTGILCVCRIAGEQHRLATYRGARLTAERMEAGCYHAEVRQGAYQMDVHVSHAGGGALRAPVMGQMDRIITEYPDCAAHVRLRQGGRTLLDADGDGCGFECAR